MEKKSDCNYCQVSCRNPVKPTEKCSSWTRPRGTFKLWELALEHPQGFHDVLQVFDRQINQLKV